MQIRSHKLRLCVVFLFLSTFLTFTLFSATNPATQIVINTPDTIQIRPSGEVTLDLEFFIPLGHFIYLATRNPAPNQKIKSPQVIGFSFNKNSGLEISNVKMPAGTQNKNNTTLSGKGTFRLVIADKAGLKPGITVNIPLMIDLEIATNKSAYPPYTLQQNLTFQVAGKSGTSLTSSGSDWVGGQPDKVITQGTNTSSVAHAVWQPGLKEAETSMQRTEQLILLYFVSESNKCADCIWMDSNTFQDKTVLNLLGNSFLAVRIPDTIGGKLNPEMAKYKVKAVPTILIIDSKGNIYYQQSGRVAAKTLVNSIKDYAKSPKQYQAEKPGTGIKDSISGNIKDSEVTSHINGSVTDLSDSNKTSFTDTSTTTTSLSDNSSSKGSGNVAAVLYYRNNQIIAFLKDGNYSEYQLSNNRINLMRTLPVNNKTWPGLEKYSSRITAALNWDDSKGHIFLNNGTYLRINLKSRSVDPGYPKPIDKLSWPGLEKVGSQISGAARWADHKIYFFLTSGEYLRYDMKSLSVEKGYPQPVNNKVWPGLLPYAKRIRGIVDEEEGYAFFFMDNGEIVRYNVKMNRIEPDGKSSMP